MMLALRGRPVVTTYRAYVTRRAGKHGVSYQAVLRAGTTKPRISVGTYATAEEALKACQDKLDGRTPPASNRRGPKPGKKMANRKPSTPAIPAKPSINPDRLAMLRQVYFAKYA